MKTSGRHHLKTESPVIHAKGLLRHAGLRAKKGLGQHFLIDEDVLKVIVSAAELVANDVVVEIGPGLGVLTRELSQNAGYVIAVELDDKLTALLKQTMASRGNVLVVNQDILKIDPGALLQEAKTKFRLETGDALNYKVVANLPYYITSPVLRHFLEAKNKPTVM
ncbi:MAG: hypothetical protein HY662_02330, partial [Chloroflexi bacterium]|nr:hypothetical protein [Chloroflexota bacterium]